MSIWQPKQHGFESGEAGKRSFNKKQEPHIMDLHEYRAWVLGGLAKDNVPTKQLPDGSIVAKFGTQTKIKTPAMLEADWNDYVDDMNAKINQQIATEIPFEEAARLASH